jgi:methylenetetrahydrofolate dehydrogenase (NADP+)/methenyltetrahydrofolate cyclohydrolase
LVVVTVGNDPASEVYVGHKEKACIKTGMGFERKVFPESMSESELIAEIEGLNADSSVSGLIVQLPLPKSISANRAIKAIDPRKDVDGFHAYNVGKMMISTEFEDLAPCTPKGMMLLLEEYGVNLAGKEAVVLGRSNIVGKPAAIMLMNRDATVTVCHSRTKNVFEHTKRADLLIVAVGQPEMIRGEHVKEGAVVLDVGIHRRSDGKLTGDVHFESVEPKASMITPVPGGVGPLTVACLLANTVTAARRNANL